MSYKLGLRKTMLMGEFPEHQRNEAFPHTSSEILPIPVEATFLSFYF